MDIPTFTTIPFHLLPQLRDSRLQYSSYKLSPEEPMTGRTAVAILLHGPAGTVDLLWQKPSDHAQELMSDLGHSWYESGALSIGWHSRTQRRAECHNGSCVVLARGPYGPGECWHEWSYCDGQEYGPVIDAQQWVKMGEMMEAFYRRWVG